MSNLFKEFKEMPMSLKRLEHASLLNVSKKHTSDTSVLNLPPPKRKMCQTISLMMCRETYYVVDL